MNLPMPSSPILLSKGEQTLEWTFQLRICGVSIVHIFLGNAIVGVPVGMLMPLIPPLPNVIIEVFGICFALLVFVLLLFALSGERPNRKLRINCHTITLTDTNAFGTKERQMFADGAKFYCVHLNFFERLFTFDMYRMSSAYHIEINQIGEIFLFPCTDKREQLQIAKRIKGIGLGG